MLIIRLVVIMCVKCWFMIVVSGLNVGLVMCFYDRW